MGIISIRKEQSMNKLIKKNIGFILGPLISALLGFIILPIISRALSPAEYGKTAAFTVIQALAPSILYYGLDQSFVREYNIETDKKKLLSNSVFLPLITSTLFLGVCSFIYIIFPKNIYTFSFFAASLCFVLLPLERFILLEFRMRNRSLLFAFSNVIIKIFVFISTLILLYFNNDYRSVVIGTVIGQILADILIIWLNKGISFSLKKINLHFLKSLLKFGIPFVPSSIILWMLNSTDRITLQYFSDSESVGLYLMAIKIVSILTIFQNIFITIWVPIAFRWESEKKSNEIFHKVSEVLAFSMTIVFLFVLLFQNLIIILLGSEYKDALKIFPFLLFYPIMFSLSETTGIGISFSRKTNYNLIVSLLVLVINIFLCILLIPYFGAVGASIATGFSYIALFIIKSNFSRKLWCNFTMSYFYYNILYLLIVCVVNVFGVSKYNEFMNFLFIIFFVLINIKKILKSVKFIIKESK